ncbi:MAG: PD-(D/E)XK nuclease family protein [Deltaproteobacteria bacterium]
MHPLVGLQLSGNTLTALDDTALDPLGSRGQLGRPVWNEQRLLADLELRLGLPRTRVSEGLRVQQWSKRLSRLVADEQPSAPYYASAYAVDPSGTAAQLLRLRDELVDAGWDGAPLTGAERLTTLSRLESREGPPLPAGRADRLAAVEAELAQGTRTPYAALDLVDDLGLWSGRWRRILERLQELGTRLAHTGPAWPSASGDGDLARFQRALLGEGSRTRRPPAGDGSLVLLRAATSSQLAEPTAALLAADSAVSTVVVRGLDPGPLDAALARQGLARQGVVQRSRWRPALQVLRLALSVAFVPRDPRRVLELLTLPSGPFAGRPGRQLAAALCDRPGIGNAFWARAKQELSEEQRLRVAEWLEAPCLEPSGASRHALLEVAERVLGWLSRRVFLEEPSVASAAEQAGAFVDALRSDARERLDRPAVEQLLQDLTEESSSASSAAEEAGRLDHVDSPERLLAPRDRVVWWGFAGEPASPRPLFRRAELELLRRAGLVLVDPLAKLRARFAGFQRAVHAARQQLVLVIPEQVAGERCQPHPLLDELVARVLESERALAELTLSPHELARGERLAARLAPVATHTALPLPLPSGRRQWQIDPTLIRPREAESASSLEKLLGCPLAWTLDYQAGLRTTSRGGLPSGPLLAGKLGHRLLEELHLRGQLEGESAAVRLAAERTFDELLESEASILLASGTSDERNQLRTELVGAAVALSALLREACLEIVGVEVPVQAEFQGRPLRGSIDVLLRAADGQELVLDLKYGSHTYAEKLARGHALQLAVYAEARRQQAGAERLPPAGYFSLKNQRLIATDAAPRFHQYPSRGPAVSETWRRAQGTLGAIAATLGSGRIPVAGVQAMEAAGFLQVLGVTTNRVGEHLALPAEGTCKYCSFGGVCGRSWEQPW